MRQQNVVSLIKNAEIKGELTGNVNSTPVIKADINGRFNGIIIETKTVKELIADGLPDKDILKKYSYKDLCFFIKEVNEIKLDTYSDAEKEIEDLIRHPYTSHPSFDPFGENKRRFMLNIYELLNINILLYTIVGAFIASNCYNISFKNLIRSSYYKPKYLWLMLNYLRQLNLIGYLMYENRNLLKDSHINYINVDVNANDYKSYVRHLYATYTKINPDWPSQYQSHINLNFINNIYRTNPIGTTEVDTSNIFDNINPVPYIMK